VKEKRTEDQKTTDSIKQLKVSVATPLVAGFDVSIDGRFSGVHRGSGSIR